LVIERRDMRVRNIKEYKPKYFWVISEWKKWFRKYGLVEMYKTKKQCESEQGCEAIKIRVFID